MLYSLELPSNKHHHTVPAHPRIIFNANPSAVVSLRDNHTLLHTFTTEQYGIAVVLGTLDESLARLVRFLNEQRIYLVGRLMPPHHEGHGFNVQNYPQATSRYREFRVWATAHRLSFDALGLHIEQPAHIRAIHQWRLRDVARHLWLAQENVLYTAARANYAELINSMHHDGYDVHAYQLPLLIDDRRAGTTLIQRALDVVDIPADVEVLFCQQLFPMIPNDALQSALIASYAASVDGIGINTIHTTTAATTIDDWHTIERNMLLASHATDTIYLATLETCLEHTLLPRIKAINWQREPHMVWKQRIMVDSVRSLMLMVLLFARYSHLLFAWSGWGVALVLYMQQRQQRKKHRPHS